MSVNEKKWLVMHMHMQLSVTDLCEKLSVQAMLHSSTHRCTT